VSLWLLQRWWDASQLQPISTKGKVLLLYRQVVDHVNIALDSVQLGVDWVFEKLHGK
jgi:hypothetical protein